MTSLRNHCRSLYEWARGFIFFDQRSGDRSRIFPFNPLETSAPETWRVQPRHCRIRPNPCFRRALSDLALQNIHESTDLVARVSTLNAQRDDPKLPETPLELERQIPEPDVVLLMTRLAAWNQKVIIKVSNWGSRQFVSLSAHVPFV